MTLFIGLSVSLLGKILLGWSVIAVHGKVVAEHSIDGIVISEMKREKRIAIAGIVALIIGYTLEVAHFGIPGIF